MNRNAARNLQAAIVLILAGAAWYALPDEYYGAAAVSFLALAAAGIFAIKAYLRRLGLLATSVESARHDPRVFRDLQQGFGRGWLRLGTPTDPDHGLRLIRGRRSVVIEAGVILAIIGLAAFVGLIVAYSD